MADVLKLITYIISNHGYWAAFAFISVSIVPSIAVIYFLFNSSAYGKAIDKKLSEKASEAKAAHKHGNRLRKQFTQEVQDILSDLAEETNANRAVVFEFSNGTTNLVGLPFLFMTAAAEVATPGLPLIGSGHQRLNTAVISNFLVKLEKEGTIFIDDSVPMIDEYKILAQIKDKANINSALFCSIQGIDETIGFLVLVTTKSSRNSLDLQKVLLPTSKAAQKIGSMINFDEIEEREREKNKFKWWWQK